MAIGEVIGVSVEATASVLVVVLVGALLCRYGYFPKDTQNGVSGLYAHLFLPFLLFSKVASAVDSNTLIHWISIPIMCGIFIGVCLALGWVVGTILRLPRQHTLFVMSSLAFPNTTSVPLALTDRLSNSPILLRDVTDTAADVRTRAFAYILFYTVFSNMGRWGVAYNLMRPPPAVVVTDNVELVGRDCEEEEGTMPAPATPQSPAAEPYGWKAVVRKVMNPPLWACLLALFVGLFPSIGEFRLKDVFFGDSVVGRLLHWAIDLFARCAVPSLLLILGGKMSQGPGVGLRQDGMKPLALPAIIVCRLVLLPIVSLLLVRVAWGMGVLVKDPVYLLVLLLNNSGPTAVNLLIMCVLHKTLEGTMGALLFYSYIASIVSWAVWCTVFLWFLSTLTP